MKYVVDSNVLIAVLNRREPCYSRFRARAPDEIGIRFWSWRSSGHRWYSHRAVSPVAGAIVLVA